MRFTFLNLTRGGWVAIHKAGCRDIAKTVRRGDAQDSGWDAEAPDVHAAVRDFLADNEFDNVTEADFTIFPCCAKEG